MSVQLAMFPDAGPKHPVKVYLVGRGCIDAQGIWIKDEETGLGVGYATVHGASHKEALERAHLIIKSVNQHDALLAAAQRIIEAFENGYDGVPTPEDLEDALKLAYKAVGVKG